MHTDLVQDLRYKLQKRVRRVRSSTSHRDRFLEYIDQFLSFISQQSLSRGIIENLNSEHSGLLSKADAAVNEGSNLRLKGLSEPKRAAISYFFLKRVCDKYNKPNERLNIGSIVSNISSMYRVSDDSENRKYVLDHFVKYLYDFIDEHVDDQRALLALLERYKHRSEWFERERLFELWEDDTKRGERELAEDLYAYLYDQGVEFTIEPYSVSGEADLVAAQTEEEPLIADAKIFNPKNSKGRSYIADGFHQVYTYTQDHNQPFGYLVIFNVTEDKLNFALSDVAQSTPYVTHNGKTIFFLEVDIHPYEEPASQRGKLKTQEITADYLIREAELDTA